MSQVNKYIFREYDIRGNVSEDFPEHVVSKLGKAFGTFINRAGGREVAISGDIRLTTPVLMNQFKALMNLSSRTIGNDSMPDTSINEVIDGLEEVAEDDFTPTTPSTTKKFGSLGQAGQEIVDQFLQFINRDPKFPLVTIILSAITFDLSFFAKLTILEVPSLVS